MLLDEALARGLVELAEIDRGGSVPKLRVRNRGDRPVLIVEGTELRGGKQNRVANATVLVPAGVQVTDHTLRGRMRATVTDSTITGRGYASNQREVWDAADQTFTSLGTRSASHCASDAYDAQRDQTARAAASFPATPDQIGLVACVDGAPVALELFADPLVFARMRPSLLAAHATSALAGGTSRRFPDSAAFLGALGQFP